MSEAINTARRVERLEERNAHLEKQYDALNEVVISHQRQIQKMQKLVDRVMESLDTQEMERIKANNARPPHYQ